MLSKSIENLFWRNVISCFYMLHKKVEINSYEELCETSFMFNEGIRICNKVIVNQELMKNAIFLIKHLRNDENFYSHDEFISKYNLQIDFLTYFAILSAIKKYFNFEDYKKTGTMMKYQPSLEKIMKYKSGASNIYQAFLDSPKQCKGMLKWQVQIGIEQEEWLSNFVLLKSTTKDTKLRWFQFRILHNILTTNRSVSKYKDTQSHLCTFCNDHSETIQHLFWDCKKTSSFWNDLLNLVNSRCKHVHNFNLNKNLVIFGRSDMVFTDDICNLMILLAKYFIYRCKVNNSPLLIKLFVSEFYKTYCIENTISEYNRNQMNRWIPYLDLFKGLL